MTENELLSRKYFKEIFILNSLYTKLIKFVEDDIKCRRVGYRTYHTKYWNNLHEQVKTYIISNKYFVNNEKDDCIHIEFIKRFQPEGQYIIQIDFKGLYYVNCLKRFYKDEKYSLENMHDLRGTHFPLLISQFYVSQSRELPFRPLLVLKYIKQEISVVDIPGFIDVKKYGNKYHINKFDMKGLEIANKIIDSIITGEIHQGL